jgi:hypothetical protein
MTLVIPGLALARTRNLDVREKNKRKPTSRFRVHANASPGMTSVIMTIVVAV